MRQRHCLCQLNLPDLAIRLRGVKYQLGLKVQGKYRDFLQIWPRTMPFGAATRHALASDG